jgi:hypothetical protein
MTWVKLDDHFFMHPKIMTVGPAAAWLWVASIGYANANLTDGFIPAGALPMIAMTHRNKASELASKLVAARLWEKQSNAGYFIHDYKDWNPSASEVLAKRKENSDRVQAYRERHRQPKSSPGNGLGNEDVMHYNRVGNANVTLPLLPLRLPHQYQSKSPAEETDVISAGASPPEVSLPSDRVPISPPDRSPIGTAPSCPTESPEAPVVAIGHPSQAATLTAALCETTGQVTEPVSSQPQTLTDTHTNPGEAVWPSWPMLFTLLALPTAATSCPSSAPEPTEPAILTTPQEPGLMELFGLTTWPVVESLSDQPHSPAETHTVLPETPAIPGTPVTIPGTSSVILGTPEPTLPAAAASWPPTKPKPKWLTMLHASREPALTELPKLATQPNAEPLSSQPQAVIEAHTLFPETPPVCPPARAKSSPRPKGGRMVPTAGEQAVFDHWVTVMGKTGRAIFADERIKPVRERLAAGFTIDDLKQAIDGCAKSTFHMGVNKEHRQYNDLELICRDAKRVESFLTTAEGKALASKAEKAALDPKRPYMQSASREEIAASIARRKQNGRRSYSDIAACIAAGIGI